MDPAPDAGPSWDRLAAHRDDLLRIAAGRASSPEAAENAVQEALARAAARWHLLDQDQLGAWLSVVTMNLCADEHRHRSRERRQLHRLHQSAAPDPADLVLDRLEDAWVVAQVAELPDRQRQVVYAVADEGGGLPRPDRDVARCVGPLGTAGRESGSGRCGSRGHPSLDGRGRSRRRTTNGSDDTDLLPCAGRGGGSCVLPRIPHQGARATARLQGRAGAVSRRRRHSRGSRPDDPRGDPRLHRPRCRDQPELHRLSTKTERLSAAHMTTVTTPEICIPVAWGASS
jgi:hypothetical protein